MRAWGLGTVVWVAAFVASCNCGNGERMRRVVPWLEASPAALDFGATTLGVGVRRTTLLTQHGVVPARIGAVRIEPDDGVFTVSALPDEIPLRDAVELPVRYRPLVEAEHRATLFVEVQDGPTLELPLVGRGVDARALPEGPVDFGRPALGATRVRPLVLHNARETEVTASFRFEGPDAHEFTGAAELRVGPGATVRPELSYAPRDRPGPRDVVLKLVACPTCTEQDVPVFADAVPDTFVVDPDPVDLGSVGIDQEHAVVVTFTNATDELVRVDSLLLEGGTDPGFLLDVPAFPVLVAGLDAFHATVRFSPTRLGPAAGSMRLASDAVPKPERVVALTATGGGSQLVVVPSRLDFGPLATGLRRTLRVTIANGGADPAAAPLRIASLALQGDGFVVARGVPPGTALAAGQRVEAELAFAPDAEGPFTGTLTVTSDEARTPTADVLLAGVGLPAAACELDVQPPVLDFGLVKAGKGASLGVRVTNVGAGPCSLWNARIEGDPAFTLSRDRGTTVLNPGVGMYVPVAFRPAVVARFGAALLFDTSRQAAPQLAVPITAGSDATCLRPEPTYLQFGTRRIDCGPAELEGTYRNACTAPLDVTDLRLGLGTDAFTFELANRSSLPARLGRDETVRYRVRMTPVRPGYTSHALFADVSDATLPVLATLSADVQDDALHDETRVQPRPARVDLLWVVDNTASMRDERAQLARGLAKFLAIGDARGMEYQIGVTTTGVGAAPPGSGEACPGGADGAEAGRLFPVDGARARIVTPTTPDRADVLARNVQVGGCHAVEEGLLAARLALSSPLVNQADDPRTPRPADGNRGLVRPDAQLAIVVVSDEDDESPDSLSANVRALRDLKPTTPLSFHAIVAPEGGCATAVEAGGRYLAASREIGGVEVNVCDDDWSPGLEALADAVFRPVSRYVLEAPAELSSLDVTVDGRAATGWHYDEQERAIVFDPPPAAGALLRFRYREPCP